MAGVAGLACTVGATGLAMAGFAARTTAGVAALTMAGVTGLPGHAGADLDQSR